MKDDDRKEESGGGDEKEARAVQEASFEGESESVLSFVGRCGAGACGSPQNETGYVGGDVRSAREAVPRPRAEVFKTELTK